jgi:transcriptional regulator with GAF, ATPase, and Fis domain
MPYPIPANEIRRIASLKSLQILDTECSPDFDNVVELARQLFDVPMSVISFVDEHRQWFKASMGLPILESARDASFCAHTICSDAPFIVPDALEDCRFKDSIFVNGEPKIRFYAGLPLSLHDGLNIGSLCILDIKTRTITDDDLKRLYRLRDLAASLVRSHERSIQIKEQNDFITQQKDALKKKSQLLESACQLGKIGAWERGLETGELNLSDGMYNLFDMRPGSKMDSEKILGFYSEPDRSRLKIAIDNADAEGKPYSFVGRIQSRSRIFR